MFSNNKKTKINIDMSNWLHISPTSGRGSTQMTISADTNETTDVRKAKIIITAGTLSKTIEVVQYPMAGDIICTYNQGSGGVKLINMISILDAALVSSEYGSVRLTGSGLNQLTATTVYSFSGQTPSQLTVNYYLNSNFNGTLARDVFGNLQGLVSVNIKDKVNTLSETFYNNMNLERIELSSGVTGYSVGYGYIVGGSVTYMCPKLYQFSGDSPLVLNQNMLAYQNKIIGITLGSVSQVNIPNNITGLTYGLCEIPADYPNSISAVTLPESLTTIDSHCFGNLNITGLSIPSSVTTIGLNVFSGCTQLTAITANNATCSAVTISPTTFFEIATGGTLYYPEGSDYSTWLSDDEYYLGYYLWKDSRAVTIDISASTPSLTFDYNQVGIASGLSITITSNLSGYTFQINDDWIGISGTPASGDVVFTAYTLSMNTGTTRNGVINVIYNQEVVLSIAIAQLYYREENVTISVNPTELTFASTASSSTYAQSVTVSSNVVYTYSASTNWITVSGTPASGTTTISVYTNSNNTGEARNGFVFIQYSGATYAIISVTQSSAITANITVTPTALTFSSGVTGSSCAKTITVTSNVLYTIEVGNTSLYAVSGIPAIGTTTFSVYPKTKTLTGSNVNIKYNNTTVTSVTISRTSQQFAIAVDTCGGPSYWQKDIDGFYSGQTTVTVTANTSYGIALSRYDSDVSFSHQVNTYNGSSTNWTIMPSGVTTYTITHGYGRQDLWTQKLIIFIKDLDGTGDLAVYGITEYSIRVSQYGNVTTGKYFTAATTTIVAGSSAERFYIPANANVPIGASGYTGGPGVSWAFAGRDENYMYIETKQNTSGNQKQETVDMYFTGCDTSGAWDTSSSLTVTVTQGSSDYLTKSCDTTGITFTSGATGASCAQTVTINSTVPYTYRTLSDWFTVSGTPGTGTTQLTIYPNTTYSGPWLGRYSVIMLEYNGALYGSILVTQRMEGVEY